MYDLTDKKKRSVFHAAVVSMLLYGCTTWTLTKSMGEKVDSNYTGMLRAILNKSWRQHTTKRLLYGYLPPIKKTIQVRRIPHAGHCWRNKDEVISDILLWTRTHGWATSGRPARTYMQQLCAHTVCSLEYLLGAMDDWDRWQERVSPTWYIYIYSHPQADCFVVSQLFTVAWHARRFKLGSKPTYVYARISVLLLSH